MPVVIRGTSEAERRVLQLAENMHREALAPLDEARALREIKLLEGLSNAALARRIHKSAGYVDERLRLLRHPEVAEAVATGGLNRSTGAALASLDDAEERRVWLARLAAGERILARDVYASEAAALGTLTSEPGRHEDGASPATKSRARRRKRASRRSAPPPSVSAAARSRA